MFFTPLHQHTPPTILQFQNNREITIEMRVYIKPNQVSHNVWPQLYTKRVWYDFSSIPSHDRCLETTKELIGPEYEISGTWIQKDHRFHVLTHICLDSETDEIFFGVTPRNL